MNSTEMSQSSSSFNDQTSSFVQRECDNESSLVSFVCSICGLNAKCRYGNVKVNGRTYVILHNYTYKEEVYYMMDPFRNRSHADKRRLAVEKSLEKSGQDNTFNILDFFVIGALCALCGQPVCIDELCSMFYGKTFCTSCINKQKEYFPKEIIEVFNYYSGY
uniref:Cysteine-rich DPF motif domain-containing protein 1 n=1 Tax=Syphacia muris TaxID=451379 RepID=A0A0N5AJ60_9BILA